MKKIFTLCLLVNLMMSSASPAWLLWSVKDFSKFDANPIAHDYKALYEYLHTYVNTINDYSIFQQSLCAEWIKDQAFKEGNVVCLYLVVRNFLETIAKTLDPYNITYNPDLNECLTVIMLCLQRVAYDALHHYAQFQDEKVFNVYKIFKHKFHILLKYLPTTIPLTALKKISTCWTHALEHWQYQERSKYLLVNSEIASSDWTKRQLPCRWVESFDWKSYINPLSQGIIWGPIPAGLKIDGDRYKANGEKVYKAMLCIFNGKYGAASWDDFFTSYEFPLDIQTTQKLLKLRD